MMFGRGENDIRQWRQILQVLESETDYHSRLDALLAKVSELTGMPACCLYLLDDSGQRFRLERSRLPTAPGKRESARTPFEAMAEGGAGAIIPSPPLDLYSVQNSGVHQLCWCWSRAPALQKLLLHRKLDSSGLGVLIAAYRKAQEAGGVW